MHVPLVQRWLAPNASVQFMSLAQSAQKCVVWLQILPLHWLFCWQLPATQVAVAPVPRQMKLFVEFPYAVWQAESAPQLLQTPFAQTPLIAAAPAAPPVPGIVQLVPLVQEGVVPPV